MPWKLPFIQNVSAILFVLLWENSWGNFERESNIVNSENKEAFVMFLCYYAGSRENYRHRLDLFGHAQISQGIGFVCSSWSCMKLWHLSLSDSSSILETWVFIDRFMLPTSSATRNCYMSTQICLITRKTFFKYLEWVAQSTCNTSSSITMGAILL